MPTPPIAPIVSRELFDAVQKQLEAKRNARAQKHQASGALLIGKLFDQYGRPMTPTYACKGSRRYRYYVSRPASAEFNAPKQPIIRVRADDVEQAIVRALKHPKVDASKDARTDEELIANALSAANLQTVGIELRLTSEAARRWGDEGFLVEWTATPACVRRELLGRQLEDEPQSAIRIDAKTRASLVRAIARGRAWLQEIVSGEVPDAETIASREKLTSRFVRITLSLAFLSPDIVAAAAEAKLPSKVGQRFLSGVPMLWGDQ